MLIIIDVQNNCLHEIMFDQTVERAQELDDYFIKHNSTCGPLHGLPIRLKDQFYVKGVETTMGYIGWIDTYEGDTDLSEVYKVESQIVIDLLSSRSYYVLQSELLNENSTDLVLTLVS
jgi:amidase